MRRTDGTQRVDLSGMTSNLAMHPPGYALCVQYSYSAGPHFQFVFQQAIRGFADELRDARAAIKAAAAAQRRRAASNPAGARPGPSPTDTTAIHMARVVWLMHGYRPGPLPNACFPNTPERMLCLQHLVVRELERVGVELVDLATIEMDSPAQWFYDAVHIAGAGGIQRWGSGLELMAVQVLLNSVCGPNAAEAEGARGRAARGKGAHE